MTSNKNKFKELIIGMRQAYNKNQNAMEYAKKILKNDPDDAFNSIAILIAYDLQAGTYINEAKKNIQFNKTWCKQLAKLIDPILSDQESIMEVGVGEATTLKGVVKILENKLSFAAGFDISWSRIMKGHSYLKHYLNNTKLFVGDLLSIPLPDNSIDVVYRSHSLEPNRGLGKRIILECMRVAKKAVVLVEPIYELASKKAQIRMDKHNYIKGLYQTSKDLDLKILDYRLLEHTSNLLNPSGVLSLKKLKNSKLQIMSKKFFLNNSFFRCPITSSKLHLDREGFFRSKLGIAYPVMSGIPLLRPDHAIISSKFK